MIIGAGQIFKRMYRNGFIFVDTLPRDNRGSLNFKVTSTKLPYFLQKFQLVIIGAVQIFKWLHKICHIFEETSAPDNRGSLNWQVTSTKLPYFSEKFSS